MDNLAKIKEIQKQMNAINTVIEDLLTSEMKQQNHSQIDIQRIEQLGKQVPFQSHFVSFLDEDVAVKYCTLLASAVRLLEDTEKKIRQYYFIARILHSRKVRCSLEEIITNAELVGISDFTFMKQELGEDSKVFLFDLLLQISFEGKIEEKQLDYFCEVFAYDSVSEKDIKSIFKAVSCVLLENMEELLEDDSNFPVEKIFYYFKDVDIVTSVEEIFKAKKENLIIVGIKEFETISSKERLVETKTENGVSVNVEKIKYSFHVNTLKKRNIVFLKCAFKNIDSMDGIGMKITFKNCDFHECGFLSFAETVINQCYFKKCGNTKNIMLKIKAGKIMNCKFEECSVTDIKEQSITSKKLCVEEGALIYLGKGVIAHCEYEKCRVIRKKEVRSNGLFNMSSMSWMIHYSSVDKSDKSAFVQTLNLIYSKNGIIECCRFFECQCEDLEENRIENKYKYSDIKTYNFLINLVEGTEKNNIFERCVAPAKIGTARWESEA